MAIDFPNSPTNGQLFSSGTITWVYDGSKWNIQSASQSAFSPIGTIVNYGGTLAPTGWLLCNGASYNRTAYPNLFGVISTTFGQGSSPGTTFNVPDFRSNNGNFIIRANDEAVVYTTTESLLAVPIGAMQLFAMNAIPTGWLRADGSAVSRTVYADLFAAIGTTYGSGDGSTTFNLPNIAGSGAGSPLYYIKAIISGIVEPSTVVHGSSHVRGGSDVIDADRAQIDYVPSFYTRDSSPAQAGATTDLTAHLKGIDTRLNTVATQAAGGDLQGTYPNPTFKSGAAGDPIIWRPFNTAYITEISYSGAYNSSFTVTTNVPTNARYVLADVFATASFSDHQNFEFGNSSIGNAQNWVNTRGQQPSTLFGNLQRNTTIVTYTGESDGFTPNYGTWYPSITIPSSGRTIFMNNFGNSGSTGWVYLRVKAYSL